MLQDDPNGKINEILKHNRFYRKTNKNPPNRLDGVLVMKKNSSHFKNIYKDIYNRHNSTEELKSIFIEIKNSVSQADNFILGKVTREMFENMVNNV